VKAADEAATNPLHGYSVAIQTAIDVAQGKSKSRLRLDAAAMLLEVCSVPPWMQDVWVIEGDEDVAG
jgi:hypothetical protein